MKFLNPTGKPTRGTDTWGSGWYGAPRAGRLHLGLDLQAMVGQDVLAPCCGIITREAHPYGDGGPWDTGVHLDGAGTAAGLTMSIFYVRPIPGIVGASVHAGEVIGRAESLEGKYPGITGHIHVAIQRAGKPTDPTPYFAGSAPGTSDA